MAIHLSMKTSSIITLVAVFCAIFFCPLSVETCTSLVFAAGFACVVADDLTRSRKPYGRHSRERKTQLRVHRRPAPAFEYAA
jgi:hypothetical protein